MKLKTIKIIPDLSDGTVVQNDTLQAWGLYEIVDDEREGQSITYARVTFINESDNSEYPLTSESGLTVTADSVEIDKIDTLTMHTGINNGQLEITWSNGDVVTLVNLQLTVLEDKTI